MRPLQLLQLEPRQTRPLAGVPGHFAKPIIREILSLPFFDSLQNETGDELGLVALGVIGGRSATGRVSHPVLAEVCRRDKRVDFADDDGRKPRPPAPIDGF